MKKLNLIIDKEGLNLAVKEKDKSPEQLSVEVIKNACRGYGLEKKGFKKKERKLFYKVCDDLNNALDSNREVVELEDNRAEFIQKAFDEIKMNPNNLIRLVEENVEQIEEVN